MNPLNIKLYDNEHFAYPIIQIAEEGLEEFDTMLEKYQQEDTYNIDDFLLLIEEKDWYIDAVYADVERFF